MSKRSLLPREHGAYGQLAYPALSSLVMERPSVAATSLVVAAVAVFLGHEPLLVLLGRRGTRAAREDGPRARRALAVSLVVAAAGGAAAIATGSGPLWTLAPSAALACVVLVLVVREREKTTAGEITVAIALSSLALPVGALSGTPLAVAATVAAVWALGFSLATVAVREAIRHARDAALRPVYVIALPLLTALGMGVVMLWGGSWLPFAVSPFLIASLVLLASPPAPRHMKRVGWSLIAASTVALLMLVVGR